MESEFTHGVLGTTGLRVCRLGLSATYRPGEDTIRKAIESGVNYFFCYGFDSQMMSVLRDVFGNNRERYVVSTGAYNLLLGRQNFKRTLEKRLKQLKTDYIDVFLYLGVMKTRHFQARDIEELQALREDNRVRAVGISIHDRKYAAELISKGAIDVLMMRYNAAHRGAEQDIFPYAGNHDPGIVSYTATRWGYLLRRPTSWPKEGRVPTASECYRFVLSNPQVDVCLMAPSNSRHLEQNLTALREGPLSIEDLVFMRKFGDAVHGSKKWFM
jgi:aryl-alcohol dehydrogenase-like predicted oxidoreductase